MRVKLRINKVSICLTIIALGSIIVSCIIYFNKAEDNEKDIQPVAQVQTTSIKKKMMVRSIPVNGTITFAPGQIQEITFSTEVVVDKIYIQIGQMVRKGQPLVKLSLSPNEKVTLSNAQVAVSFAEKEYKRQDELKNKYLASNIDVQNALQALLKARSELNNLMNVVNKIKRPVFADTDGVVEKLNVQTGQIIPAATSIISIGGALQANCNIPAEFKDKISMNQPVLIISLNNQSLSTMSKVGEISGKIDASSATTYFTSPIKQDSGFVSGDPIMGQVYVSTADGQLYVPKSALVYDGNTPYIFINKQGVAQQESVTILFQEQDNTYINGAGIHSGDEVVYVGNYELENGMKLRVESKE